MVMKSITINKKLENGQSAVALFVQIANKYESKILVQIDGNKTVNAKSIMGVMTLNFAQGSTMEITAEGADEQDALNEITAMLCKD